jgi:hypothetical protein
VVFDFGLFSGLDWRDQAAPSATASDEADSGNKTNTVGIAVGVVVGLIVLSAICGGAFFFYRRRRNAEIEEEHRRNAAVNAFIAGGKPPSSSGGLSLSDQRLDPVMAQRRMSDGSIADNEDYSRRILRVRTTDLLKFWLNSVPTNTSAGHQRINDSSRRILEASTHDERMTSACTYLFHIGIFDGVLSGVVSAVIGWCIIILDDPLALFSVLQAVG